MAGHPVAADQPHQRCCCVGGPGAAGLNTEKGTATVANSSEETGKFFIRKVVKEEICKNEVSVIGHRVPDVAGFDADVPAEGGVLFFHLG